MFVPFVLALSLVSSVTANCPCDNRCTGGSPVICCNQECSGGCTGGNPDQCNVSTRVLMYFQWTHTCTCT